MLSFEKWKQNYRKGKQNTKKIKQKLSTKKEQQKKQRCIITIIKLKIPQYLPYPFNLTS